MKIFNQKITFENMELSRDEKEQCKKTIISSIYSSCEDEYIFIDNNFSKELLQRAVNHLNESWHSQRDE